MCILHSVNVISQTAPLYCVIRPMSCFDLYISNSVGTGAVIDLSETMCMDFCERLDEIVMSPGEAESQNFVWYEVSKHQDKWTESRQDN